MSGKQRRGGLGRGLGSLIPTAPPDDESIAPEQTAQQGEQVDVGAPGARELTESSDLPADLTAELAERSSQRPATDGSSVTGAVFAELPIEQIHANARQPRQIFDEDALAELSHSIREFGVLQPVVVRADADGYELVMGERRLRAAADAGLTHIPSIVRTTADDAMLRDALLENLHRAQLNPLEEAAAYQQLLEEFGATHDDLAQRIGRSRPQVSNTIRLLNLPLAVQRRVAAGILSAGHARALLSLDDGDQQDELAARIVAEGLSVRATEELVTLARHDGVAPKPRRTPASRVTAPAVAELAANLSDVLDTRVRVDLGRRKGRITIEFASIDDLERIVAVIAPQLSSAAETQSVAPNEP